MESITLSVINLVTVWNNMVKEGRLKVVIKIIGRKNECAKNFAIVSAKF